MIDNGYGMPLDMIRAPQDAYVASPTEEYAYPHHAPQHPPRTKRGPIEPLPLRLRVPPFARSFLLGFGLAVGTGALIVLMAVLLFAQRDAWIIAIAAVVQGITAVLIVLLTKRVADTATAALSTSGAQTAAMFEANIQAQVQRETEAMAVLQVDRPTFKALPGGRMQFNCTVRNSSTYPALNVGIQLAGGPWNWDWTTPPHEWAEINAIQSSDVIGVLAAGERHAIEMTVLSAWLTPDLVVRVEHSGLYGGALFQTWELERSGVAAGPWRQLEVLIRPSTAGAPPIQHRIALGG